MIPLTLQVELDGASLDLGALCDFRTGLDCRLRQVALVSPYAPHTDEVWGLRAFRVIRLWGAGD